MVVVSVVILKYQNCYSLSRSLRLIVNINWRKWHLEGISPIGEKWLPLIGDNSQLQRIFCMFLGMKSCRNNCIFASANVNFQSNWIEEEEETNKIEENTLFSICTYYSTIIYLVSNLWIWLWLSNLWDRYSSVVLQYLTYNGNKQTKLTCDKW